MTLTTASEGVLVHKQEMWESFELLLKGLNCIARPTCSLLYKIPVIQIPLRFSARICSAASAADLKNRLAHIPHRPESLGGFGIYKFARIRTKHTSVGLGRSTGEFCITVDMILVIQADSLMYMLQHPTCIHNYHE